MTDQNKLLLDKFEKQSKELTKALKKYDEKNTKVVHDYQDNSINTEKLEEQKIQKSIRANSRKNLVETILMVIIILVLWTVGFWFKTGVVNGLDHQMLMNASNAAHLNMLSILVNFIYYVLNLFITAKILKRGENY